MMVRLLIILNDLLYLIPVVLRRPIVNHGVKTKELPTPRVDLFWLFFSWCSLAECVTRQLPRRRLGNTNTPLCGAKEHQVCLEERGVWCRV